MTQKAMNERGLNLIFENNILHDDGKKKKEESSRGQGSWRREIGCLYSHKRTHGYTGELTNMSLKMIFCQLPPRFVFALGQQGD